MFVDYRKIWSDANGPIPYDEEGRRYDIHHIDKNRENNKLSNLQCLSIRDHYNLHKSQGDWGACNLISSRMNLTKEERLFLNQKISEAMKGKKRLPHLEETKQKMSESHKGKTFSKETIQKMRESKLRNPTKYWSGKKREGMKQNHLIHECPHCRKVGKGNVMFVWHFDNCKINPSK
jgi:hypothetical protein